MYRIAIGEQEAVGFYRIAIGYRGLYNSNRVQGFIEQQEGILFYRTAIGYRASKVFRTTTRVGVDLDRPWGL